MRTETSWKEQQDALAAARVLAGFANLEPEGVESFRRDHSDFFPKSWWDYRPTLPNGTPSPKTQWRIAQKFVRDAWFFEFDVERGPLVHLLTSVFDPSEPEPPLFERRHRPAFVVGLDIGYELQNELPFYLAVKWLGGQGWRAKTCRFCGKQFVAEHPKAQYCSFGVTVDDNFSVSADGVQMTCYWAHRKKYKHDLWSENSESINEKRRRDYRLEKKRSRHANRRSRRG